MLNIKSKKTIFALIGIFVLALIAVFAFRGNREDETYISKNFKILDEDTEIIWSAEPQNFNEESLEVFRQRINDIELELENAVLGIDEFEVYHSNLGLYYSYFGDYKSSYENYLKAIDYKSENRVIWVGLADILVFMNAPKSAEFAYLKALELNPGAEDTIIKLGLFYEKFHPEEPEKARKVFEDSLEIILEKTRVVRVFAEWLERHGDYKGAIEQYEILTELEPENAENYRRKMEELRNK